MACGGRPPQARQTPASMTRGASWCPRVPMSGCRVVMLVSAPREPQCNPTVTDTPAAPCQPCSRGIPQDLAMHCPISPPLPPREALPQVLSLADAPHPQQFQPPSRGAIQSHIARSPHGREESPHLREELWPWRAEARRKTEPQTRAPAGSREAQRREKETEEGARGTSFWTGQGATR